MNQDTPLIEARRGAVHKAHVPKGLRDRFHIEKTDKLIIRLLSR